MTFRHILQLLFWLLFSDCISLLLKHGADPRCADQDGFTALDKAKDDATKSLLRDALKQLDLKVDDVGQSTRCCCFRISLFI